ncbi:hypothetical protein IBX65_03810 [Candidatus Aerophobetes bacterium]|nr:hypothetical protein [Candidatus Aerophobetes bacterium]
MDELNVAANFRVRKESVNTVGQASRLSLQTHGSAGNLHTLKGAATFCQD